MAANGLDAKIRDIHTRIQKERKMIEGFKAMSQATSNPDTQKSCQSKIRDSEKSIQWFEQSLRELQKKRTSTPSSDASSITPSTSAEKTLPSSSSASFRSASAASSQTTLSSNASSARKTLPPTPGSGLDGTMSSGMGGQPQPPGAAWNTGYSPSIRRRANFTNLDLIKYDTPLNSAKISKMLNQLEFKLRVEKEYMQGIEKMAKLYQVEGDKKARSDAEAKRIESKGKKDLLEAALKRYKTLDVMGGVFDEEDAPDDDDAKGLRRRPVSGSLQITIKSARDIEHLPSNKRKPTETVVVVKVEDTPRARTHPSRTDRWNEDFELHVDKANEVEVTIYDKPYGNDPPTPIGMLWIRLSDVVDELRRKKVGAEAGAGWVTAAGMEAPSSGPGAPHGHQHSNSMGGGSGPSQALDTPVAAHLPANAQSAALRPGTTVDGIDAWFSVEPAGQIDLHLNFVKSNVRKRPYDAGGLGRQGALRKRREDVVEQNGHKFIQKQFYGVVLCAFCQEFLLKAAGMQCEDCRYTCHKKCFDKVVTKCVSKSDAESDRDGDKINHRIPHRFEPITSMSPSWCCHCGQIVPLSRKKARRCSECNLSCHADCAHLVPDFCGMSMEMARQLIGDIRTINTNKSRVGPVRQISALPPLGAGRSGPPSPSRVPPPSQASRQTPVGALTDDAKRMQIDPRMADYQQQQQQPPSRMPPQQPPQAIPPRIQQSQSDYQPQQPQQQQQGLPPRPSGPASPGPRQQQAPPARVPNQYPLPSSAQQQMPGHGRQGSFAGLPPGAAPPQVQGQADYNQQLRPQPLQQGARPQSAFEVPQQQQPQSIQGQAQGPRPMSTHGAQGIQAQLQQEQNQRMSQHQQQQSMQQPMQIDQKPPQQMQQQQQRPAPPQQGPSYAQQQPQHAQQHSVSSFPVPQQGIPPQQAQQLQQQQQRPPSAPTTPSKARPQVAAQPSATGTRKVSLDDFNFLAVLGKGNFGKVMLAEEKRSNRLWAIKVLKKEFIIENDEIESTKSEKRVFLAAARERHPFLLDLHSCFQTETRIYFVMEYISGGDLMLHIQREQFTPRRARFYAAEVLLALEYFHKQGIVYRDLKLDNILLTLDGHVKVADYGLCKENMWYGKTTSTFCGTPEFMAPEILLEQRYGRAVDWWAFGVLIYEMLLGQSPFRGDDEDEIFDAILEDEILYPIHMPRASVSILQQLLCRDPTRRLGAGPDDADEIKAHLFFKDINWDDIFHKRIPAPYYPTVDGPLDTRNFDKEFTSEQPTLTPVHSQLSAADQKEFREFSWIGPAALDM